MTLSSIWRMGWSCDSTEEKQLGVDGAGKRKQERKGKERKKVPLGRPVKRTEVLQLQEGWSTYSDRINRPSASGQGLPALCKATLELCADDGLFFKSLTSSSHTHKKIPVLN